MTLRLRLIFLAMVLAASMLAPAAPRDSTADSLVTPNGVSWYDGLIQYSTITNCVSIIQGLPYQEKGVGTYVGFLADPNAGQPAPNAVYYVHVVVAGLGNACSGMRAYIDVGLPANTSLAVDSTNKVYCFYDGTPLSPASDCPQSLPPSSFNPGMYDVPAPATASYTWPIPQGHFFEVQIPVRSSTALTNSPFQAKVWILDGNSSPWLQPQQGIYVFSSQPTIVYPSPSTINVASTTARSQVYLYKTEGVGGTGYFDLGLDVNYGIVHEPVAIPATGTAYLAWDDWGPPPLQPDTLYHWRFTFTTSMGQTYYGADQVFRTLPDGRVTVGTGIASSCTEAAFTSALAGAKDILFDCGSLPVTITLGSSQLIASNLTIHGANKVTLSRGGGGNHFQVANGAHLTLDQIGLIDGTNNADCGGSILVSGGALLTLSEVRLVNNASAISGGAVCVKPNGRADVQDALFRGNHAPAGGGIANDGTVTLVRSALTGNQATSTHGGSIRNYGSLTVTDSRFWSNAAGINGGAIDSTVAVTVTNSTFLSNTAGFRGGGINNYLGALNVGGSTFASNTAGAYGGGITNDAGTASIQASSVISNSSNGFGGGIRNSGTLTLANVTISGNQANANGAGLENAASLTVLNSTLAGNTAGTSGGNLSLTGSAYTATMKNAIVGSGSPNNCDKAATSQGHNLDSANTCGFTAPGDLANADPKLRPLQDNTGPTWTRALMPDSPAVDAGSNSGCPATDQRGITRPIDGNGDSVAACDIGAYELWPSSAPGGSLSFKIQLPLVSRVSGP